MFRPLPIAAAALALAIAAPAAIAAADPTPACFKASDLSWSPTIARKLAVIDTTGRGCVYAGEIERYRTALLADHRAAAARIAAALATPVSAH